MELGWVGVGGRKEKIASTECPARVVVCIPRDLCCAVRLLSYALDPPPEYGFFWVGSLLERLPNVYLLVWSWLCCMYYARSGLSVCVAACTVEERVCTAEEGRRMTD